MKEDNKRNLEPEMERYFLPLSKAKLCAEITCDVVFIGDKCPICGSSHNFYISKIFNK